ncbi:Tripartite tricarboxylate transporter TctB family protein [Tranquillimonas rosea]|uniref:Tripartite tricarboxylate transporter TctB family protein n=1 Tax=Tranquillimonas rosea TaxID=641238 RepID=A0A1H9X929_9RHOB|nr:tripartite tricarboxylate transporter TctB family protein [Tranquillimonas rosea]SES42581.1 Tripartite tricarboxylate transporter TctB family protein [Tranquillimonas rosea]
MKVLSGRVVFDLVLLAGAVWGLVQARSLPAAFGPGQIGPGDFPAAVMIIAIVALLAVLWQDLRASREEPRAEEGSTERVGLAETFGVLATGVLLAGYIALLEPLGFLASTVAFLFLAVLSCTWFLDRPDSGAAWGRLLLSAAVLAVAGTGLSYVVFTYGFGLIFP